MTKHYEEKIVPAKKEQVLSKVSCDLCGVEKLAGRLWPNSTHELRQEDCTVECKTGTTYPEGGFGESCTIDVCTTCFKQKIVPFFNAMRDQTKTSEIEFKEWSW